MLIIAAVAKHSSDRGAEPVVTTQEETTTKKSGRLGARVGTWVNRVENFIYGGKEADNDEMYQVNQAKIAIAKGGILGVGPGNSTTRDYLPQAYNDFIFAIIIEEYGIIGGAFLVFVYLVFYIDVSGYLKSAPLPLEHF
jgi:cell division protein FtsW